LSQKIIAEYMSVYQGLAIKSRQPQEFSTATLTADRLSHRELEGIYGGGGEEFVELKRASKNKIIFKQGKSTLVLKRKGNNLYGTKYRLLNFIPLPVKTLLFSFKKVGDRIYLKAIDNKSKEAQLLSVKDPECKLSPSWKSRCGSYEVINNCPGTITMKPVEIRVVKNKILLFRKDDLSELTDNIGFNPVSDSLAISDGTDRGSGAALRVLPNGNLYYSGFEFRLKLENTQVTLKR
jgi:hypothetical protein